MVPIVTKLNTLTSQQQSLSTIKDYLCVILKTFSSSIFRLSICENYYLLLILSSNFQHIFHISGILIIYFYSYLSIFHNVVLII